MIYQVKDIVKDVKVCIDQNMESGALLEEGDLDTLTMDEIVRSKIEEAARRVELEAPYYMLEQGHNFGDTIYWEELESGYVYLPDDFMRLLVFEMSDWETAVYGAISVDDPIYAKQRSRYKGIRGNTQTPVVAIAVRPTGRVLEFYSCKSEEATISRAMYVPEPKIDGNEGIDISEKLYTAVVYMVAGLVAMSYGDLEKGKMMIEMSKTYMQ